LYNSDNSKDEYGLPRLRGCAVWYDRWLRYILQQEASVYQNNVVGTKSSIQVHIGANACGSQDGDDVSPLTVQSDYISDDPLHMCRTKH